MICERDSCLPSSVLSLFRTQSDHTGRLVGLCEAKRFARNCYVSDLNEGMKKFFTDHDLRMFADMTWVAF